MFARLLTFCDCADSAAETLHYNARNMHATQVADFKEV